MQRRQRSLPRAFLRAGLVLLAVALLILGATLLFAAPIAETVAARALNARGFGPAQLDITRLGPGALSVRNLEAMGGAVRVAEFDMVYDWRELLTRRAQSLRISGLQAAITWRDDGSIWLGPTQLYPRPTPATTTEPASAEPPPPSEPFRFASVVLDQSRIDLSLPDGALAVSLAGTVVENEATGRAIELNVAAEDPRLTMAFTVDAVDGKDTPPQGAFTLDYKVAGLTLPGVASSIAGSAHLAAAFDASGARSQDSRADLNFVPAERTYGTFAVLGVAPGQTVRVDIAGTNSRLLKFNLDRTTMPPRATADLGIAVTAAGAELRLEALGWSDVPLGGVSPQDFSFDRLALSARGLSIMGTRADALVALTEFKGPIAVAGGKVAAQMKSTGGDAKRIEAKIGGDVRLDGLSLSIELAEGWAEAEDLTVGSVRAGGVSRVALAPKAEGGPTSQQLNVVFGNGVTLTPDLNLSVAVPRILPGRPATDTVPAALTLPRLTLQGYVNQGAEERANARLNIGLADGRLTHSMAHLVAIGGALVFDGAVWSGPLSAQLAEAPDPTRPRGLDRLGAILKSNINIGSHSIDIKGQILSNAEHEVGTFSLSQRGDQPAVASLLIPARQWAASPTFMDVFGPVAGLTNTTGTFGIDVRASPTNTGLGGSVKLAFADFGFTAGAMTVRGLNSVITLDQLWPLRAPAAQRIAVAQLTAGVPFTEGDITVELNGSGAARVTSANLKLTGGVVVGNDIVVPFDGSTQRFTMDVTNVDIDRLVKTFPTQGLSASGKLGGILPMRIQNSRLYIDAAKLTGRNGTIVYKPATPPAALAQGGGNVALQALTNFQFEEITANINGDVAKDLRVGLTLKGKNPDLYGGYPIEFNLNLDGPLNRLVRQGLAGYTVPEDIRQRLEQQGLSGTSQN